MINVFDCNGLLIRKGNIISDTASISKEKVESINADDSYVTCESGKKIGFATLHKRWRKL